MAREFCECRKKIFETTIFDDELNQNKGNADVLPSSLKDLIVNVHNYKHR